MCDYCGYELDAHERVMRGDGRMYCGVCIGRLTLDVEPFMADWADFQPAPLANGTAP